ncbi:SPOR domain-containing protein [Hydrogenimonas sp. SS33]|uniref:SPOR domain-containing protein n=1 Tax=Hydrogenimonas leucolamina TaxID=2954236 RepID=UPI00336C2D13
MEEKNNDLDNLIIPKDKPSGLKKLLLAAAGLLLVLILIILVTKSLVEPEQKPQSSIILPPAPATVAKKETKEPLFEEVPIEEEKPAARSVEKTIEKAKAEQTAPKTEKPAPKPVPGKPVAAPVSESKPQPKPAAVSKPVPKPAPKPAPSKAATGRYYIQVGAFFRYPPSKKFLANIEKEGLHYVILNGMKNGTPYKKVLVGPYPTRTAAAKELPRIKRRINQNAYVTRK